MAAYEDLLAQVFNELNDPERRSASAEFQRSLCEVCLCILLLRSKAQKQEANLLFPAGVPMGIFQQLSIIDIYTGGDIDHARRDLLIPIAIRNQSGEELLITGVDSVRYYSRSLSEVQDVPRTIYQLSTNLFGLRPALTFGVELPLTYVPYIEVNNINDTFPLDDNYIQPMTRLMRVFLFMRISRFELAQEELKRFKEYVG